MWKWAQGAVASVTGAQEPEYGPEAFEPVDATVAGTNPYGQLTAKDYEWQQPAQSHVETQTFYFNTAEYYGFAQLIHSNPVNLAYTSQFTFLLRKVSDPEFKVWGSHRLNQAEVADKVNFKADHFSITLTPDLKQYHFTGLCGDDIQVDLYFDVVAEGFKIGKDGVSKYGTDRANPWGTMRHIFWPRCDVSGTIVLRSKNMLVDLPKGEGRGLFVMALQGMKPHHAAAKWNFLDFQSPTMSAAVMQFETPNSYGRQQSSIGAVIKDDKLLMTAVNVQIEHPTTEIESGDDGNWPVPTSIRFVLEGPKPETKDLSQPPVKVEIFGDLPHRVDRVDVMAELPAFVKRVASGLSGTNPFIYQYYNELTAKVTVEGKTFEEKGSAFSEATFIS